jgi:hypothetical protein
MWGTIATALLLTSVFAAPPATSPAEPKEPTDADAEHLTREQRVDRLFNYLTSEYRKKLASKDWITRSVAVTSLAQFPTDDATKAIVERLTRETQPVGKLVAWQATLARAKLLSDAQFKQWQDATSKMMKEDLFSGDLRVALLQMLSSTPLTSEHRRFAQQVFTKTNSLDSADIRTLVALGRAMQAWGSPELVEDVLSLVRDKNHGTRARFVLKAAGADLKLDDDADAYRKWWKENKAEFTKRKPETGARKALRPQYIDAPVEPASVDPDDKQWYRQLELGALGLQDFDFALAIDCSRSMVGEIERVKRDLLVMYTALGQIAQHPRLAITGFACAGETKNFIKLTANKNELLSAVKSLDVFGPIGEEEWAGGIDQCIKSNAWRPAEENNRRVIVLITDEPMTPAQQEKATPIVKQAATDGFRVHAVLVFRLEDPPDPLKMEEDTPTTEPLASPMRRLRAGRVPAGARVMRGIQVYEDLIEPTGGQAIIARVPQGALGLGTPMKWTGGPMRSSTHAGPADIAPLYPRGGPTAEVLSLVLADAINPQYAERIEPLVQILTSYCQRVVWIPESR